MCIIAAKMAGVPMPDSETIRTMWANNPDGAGYMWADGKKVHIRKGFMSLAALVKDVEKTSKAVDLTEIPLVMHFRIRTHGKISPACCHPFPVSNDMGDLCKLYTTSQVAVAHNGIIPCVTPGPAVSDTMQFVVDFLAPLSNVVPDWWRSPDLCRSVETAASGRIAILSADGCLITLGKGWVQDSGGMMYSNTSYLPPTPTHIDDINTRYIPLMWLPDGAYVVDSGGPYTDDVDVLLMSESGQLYEYDYIYDLCLPVTGTAYTAAGTPIVFDHDESDYFLISEGGCVWQF